MMLKSVFLVHHVHEFGDGSESVKLIGVFSTRQYALAAVARASRLEGFRDVVDGFSIDEYVVDEDNWRSGYFTDA
jgi:hypothetical protein